MAILKNKKRSVAKVTGWRASSVYLEFGTSTESEDGWYPLDSVLLF